MKRYRQIIEQVQTPGVEQTPEYIKLLWQLICYSPKFPARLQQEQLLNEAVKFTLPVNDEYFTKQQLKFNGFIWGTGTHKILITHGWGSKAADFTDIINRLRELNDVKIIAFDAPGNGSSEGELSNLLLFIESVKAIVSTYGEPDVVIGHSLGAMANVIAFTEMNIAPRLLVSITPLIRLRENFEATMDKFGVSAEAQTSFFTAFEGLFNNKASYFNMNDKYTFDAQLNHWLAYDEHDQISPFVYMKEFLDRHPAIKTKNYDTIGHDKIIKHPQFIDDLVAIVTESLSKY